MKSFKGKAIYNPSGKAAEYSKWACNFYKGCSNGCTYCFLRKGVLAHAMGGDKPELKACFLGSEAYALFCFESEVNKNLVELQKHGLFFSFTTDPMIVATKRLTIKAIKLCNLLKVPVKVLTKCADYWYLLGMSIDFEIDKSLIAIGTTLTGHDELEPNASPNHKRINMLLEAKKSGFKTFASIEPIIDFDSSIRMIEATLPFCDLYKIGLLSGKKYPLADIHFFVHQVCTMTKAWQNKIYFKESIITQGKLQRSHGTDNCVTRDYNMFE